MAPLAVGAMQVKLVEKVEELTLYMIQMNKELEGVKARNALLEQELATLRAGGSGRSSGAGRADRSVIE